MPSIEEKLDKEIQERQIALLEVERVLFTNRYKLSKKHFAILSVQSISIIYSIWEGFVQRAFNLYIDEINNIEVEPLRIKDELYIYHMEDTFKQLWEYPTRPGRKLSYFSKLRAFFGLSKVELLSGVDTQSNVSFEILNKLLNAFCLEPFPAYWGTYTHPSPNLKDTMTTFLRYRNGVAHGGDISAEEKVTQAVYAKYKKLVLDLMYEIQIKMVDGISNETFKKAEVSA